MASRINKKPVVAAGLALCVLLAALVAALGVQSESATAGDEGVKSEHFSVLRPASDATVDTLPPSVRLQVKVSARAPYTGGAVSALGVSRIEGRDVYVVAIGSSICAFSSLGDIGTCGETPMVEEGRAFAAVPRGCGKYEVMGIVPDGVRELAVNTGSGDDGEEAIPVASNVYIHTFDAVHTVLTSGTGVAVSLPLDEYAKMNGACR